MTAAINKTYFAPGDGEKPENEVGVKALGRLNTRLGNLLVIGTVSVGNGILTLTPDIRSELGALRNDITTELCRKCDFLLENSDKLSDYHKICQACGIYRLKVKLSTLTNKSIDPKLIKTLIKVK